VRDDAFDKLVALYESLPSEPTPPQLISVREAFDELLADYQPATAEEQNVVDDMADMLAGGGD